MARKHVLVLEDNLMVRQTLVREMRQSDYEVSQAETPSEAFKTLAKAIETKTPVDLIVFSHDTNRMNALEFADKLQQNNIHILLLLTTDHPTKEFLAQLQNYKDVIAGVVIKPFSVRDLIGRVSKIIRPALTQAHPSSHSHVINPAKPAPGPDAKP